MKTEKQKFIAYLRSCGYSGKEFYFSKQIIPKHQVSSMGTHTLLYHIACVLFEGVDTKNGNLGCTTFCFYGRCRKKYKKTANNAEVLKKCITCNMASKAIKEFESWLTNSLETLASWKTII